jgi:lysophospholipase L1-like esterase
MDLGHTRSMNQVPSRYLLLAFGFFLSIPPVRSAQEEFIHPGLLHSRSDIQRMKVAVLTEKGPIFEGFKLLEKSAYAQADYRMRGPFPEWGRAPNIRTGETESDGLAVYQNALMWTITGRKVHADKAIHMLNSWVGSLKKVTGIDGVLASGLQGFMFVNAAELLRYTDSGWSEEDANRCGQWFLDAWDPTIEHYAYFANGNWETAALQTRMAIAVYCNNRTMFEDTIRYAVAGAGNGSIPHMIVYPTGQCQETTRAQHYAQLGIGLLGCAAEVAWNQGVDLYGWNDNRILKGYEYTAKYGLGEEVPYQHYLDRTGKYGIGGRHKNYTEISTISRGSFSPIFERILNHYSARRGIPVPYSTRVVKMKSPEAFNNDHLGLGTLTHRRAPVETPKAINPPGIPAGLMSRSGKEGVQLTWVRSVDPVGCIDARSYTVSRSTRAGGPYEEIASGLKVPDFLDTTAKKGRLYHYVTTATNEIGTSAPSAEIATGAGLPGGWRTTDIGKVTVPGYTKYNGRTFTLEGEGHDIDGRADEFHFLYAPMSGQGTITARIVRPMSSQWTKPGVMIRKNLDSDSPHASVLLLPHWSGALVSRSEKGGETTTGTPRQLSEAHVIKKNRLSTPYWVRLIRFRNTFTGFMSRDGFKWKELGAVELDMGHSFYVGLPACSQLKGVTTTVTYDKVSIPTWRMPVEGRIISARPEPRWHKKAWLQRHEAMNERVKKGNVDLLMIGDSITHWWDTTGKSVWDEHYGKRNAVNLAISGDRTEHVLWRLENGNLDGISPKLAVLMIGTNNHMSSPPHYTADDIRLIVQLLRRKLPSTKVLVLGIFPRGGGDEDQARQINMKVNNFICDFPDEFKRVYYLNINGTFLNGRKLRHELFPDGTHPNEKGYAAWAKAMESTIAKLMGEQ